MHGLPVGFDAGFLVGCRLEQICFSENQISLHFSAGVGITIEGGYSYQRSTLPASAPTAFVPASQSNLMELLGHAISGVEGTSNGTLTLLFDNGHELRCFDNPHYESYRIRDGAREIIV
jgi:hypothetical protein